MATLQELDEQGADGFEFVCDCGARLMLALDATEFACPLCLSRFEIAEVPIYRLPAYFPHFVFDTINVTFLRVHTA